MTQCKSTDIFSRNLDILLKWNARDAVSSIKVETFEQEIFFWGGGQVFIWEFFSSESYVNLGIITFRKI